MEYYETRYGESTRGIKDEVEKTLKRYIATNDEYLLASSIEGIYYVSINDENLRQWDFPIVIDDKVFVDIRPHLNKSDLPKNRPEIVAAYERAIFEREWVEDKRNYEAVSVYTSTVFASWISSVMTHRYDLSLQDSVVINIIMMSYYLSIFEDLKDEGLGDRQVDSVKVKVSRNVKVSSEILDHVFNAEDDNGNNELEEILSADPRDRLAHVCELINRMIQRPISELSRSGLISMIINGSWVGFMAPQLSASSLEHPPSFIGLLWRSMTSTFYEKTSIGRAVYANKRNRLTGGFQQWAKRIQHGSD